jgi:hypothetical protein
MFDVRDLFTASPFTYQTEASDGSFDEADKTDKEVYELTVSALSNFFK